MRIINTHRRLSAHTNTPSQRKTDASLAHNYLSCRVLPHAALVSQGVCTAHRYSHMLPRVPLLTQTEFDLTDTKGEEQLLVHK